MNWIPIKLSELCNVVTKGTTPTSVGYDFTDQGVPFLRIQNLYDNIVNLDNVLFISRETHLALNRSTIRPRDFLITIAGTIGRVAIVPDDFPESNCNQAIAILRFDTERLYPRFLLHWLTTQNAMSQISEKKVTATISNLSLGQIKELQIPLPPLPEQKRIAAILDKADSIRRKRQQAIKLADEFLRAVFLDMFGDPVTNPKGFTRRFIKEFYVDEKNGTKCGPFGSALKKDEYRESGIPVWNMDNISLVGDFFDDPKLWVAEEKFNDLASYSVINGDVIISRAGTVGKMGVVHTKHEKSLLSTNLIRVRFNSKLKPEFFVALMTYCKGRVGRLKVGPDGAFTHMNTGIIDSIEFPYPPVDLQEKFLAIVNRTKTQILKNVVFQNKIDETHSAISQRAFSGQL